MKRLIVLCGLMSFAMGFLGTVTALVIMMPTVVGGQDARIRAEQVTIVGDQGTDRIHLQAAPGIAAGMLVLDANGVVRARTATGMGRLGTGDEPTHAGFNVYHENGNSGGRLGVTEIPSMRSQLLLNDLEGRARGLLRVAEDGTPTILLLDANGNVIWRAP